MNVDCEQAGNFISARIDGQISVADDAALDAHLAECASCRATLEGMELQDAAMVRAFAGGREAAAGLARRVEAEMSNATGGSSRGVAAASHSGRRGAIVRWGGWIAAAAAGFIGALIFVRPASRPSATGFQVAIQPAASPATQPGDLIAHLSLVSGEVFTCPTDKKEWQPMARGEGVAPGAKIRTADAAKCELALPDGSRLRLNSGTELKLAAAGDVQLSGGQIWSAVARNAGPMCIAAGDAKVTTGGPAAQLDIARDANAATVTVVAGSALVDGPGQATTVRGGESLRLAGPSDPSRYQCEPMADPLKATRWLDDLLVLLPPDDPELLARVDALLARIVAERSNSTAVPTPGPVEHDVRARGPAWTAPIARYATNHLSAPADVERAKRRTAARLLADLAPSSRVADLIALLADDDSEVRYHAAAALNRLTGQTLGFSPDACAADPRNPAPVAAWQQWWAQNRWRYPARS